MIRSCLLAFGLLTLLPACVLGIHVCDYRATTNTCGQGMICRGGTCVPEQSTNTCTKTSECPIGESCQKGTCTKKEPITCQPTCGQGQRCEAGSCVPDNTPCQSNGACASTERCEQGKCVPKSNQCANDNDCQSGWKCNNQKCKGDNDCQPPQKCIQGNCRSSNCTRHGECAAPQVCSKSTSTCVPRETLQSCKSMADCFPGWLCNQGRCIEGCIEDSDCTAGHTCDTTRDACHVRGSQLCNKNSTCPHGQECDLSKGECATPKDCTWHDECYPGACINRKCHHPGRMKSCKTNPDCSNNESCDRGRCFPQDQPFNSCPGGQKVECPQGKHPQVCYQGQCVLDLPCKVHSNCSGCLVCDQTQQRCVRPSKTCQKHADCDVSFSCQEGLCMRTSCLPKCQQPSDCPNPSDACTSGRCQAKL